jgi:uncharacterized coiled-coil protein SlyX
MERGYLKWNFPRLLMVAVVAFLYVWHGICCELSAMLPDMDRLPQQVAELSGRLQSLRTQAESGEIRRDLAELNCENLSTLLPGTRIGWISDASLSRYLDLILQPEASPLEVARIQMQVADELRRQEEIPGKILFVASTFFSRLQEILLSRGERRESAQVAEKTEYERRLEALERLLASQASASQELRQIVNLHSMRINVLRHNLDLFEPEYECAYCMVVHSSPSTQNGITALVKKAGKFLEYPHV